MGRYKPSTRRVESVQPQRACLMALDAIGAELVAARTALASADKEDLAEHATRLHGFSGRLKSAVSDWLMGVERPGKPAEADHG